VCIGSGLARSAIEGGSGVAWLRLIVDADGGGGGEGEGSKTKGKRKIKQKSWLGGVEERRIREKRIR
jgi:hypothetical protein